MLRLATIILTFGIRPRNNKCVYHFVSKIFAFLSGREENIHCKFVSLALKCFAINNLS